MNKPRRHFADHEKVAVLKRHLLDKVPISDLCDELDIYPHQFHDWLKKFFEHGRSWPSSWKRSLKKKKRNGEP